MRRRRESLLAANDAADSIDIDIEWNGRETVMKRSWNGHLEIFSRRQVMENSRQYFLYSPISYFEENSRWVPLADFVIRFTLKTEAACRWHGYHMTNKFLRIAK